MSNLWTIVVTRHLIATEVAVKGQAWQKVIAYVANGQTLPEAATQAYVDGIGEHGKWRTPGCVVMVWICLDAQLEDPGNWIEIGAYDDSDRRERDWDSELARMAFVSADGPAAQYRPDNLRPAPPRGGNVKAGFGEVSNRAVKGPRMKAKPRPDPYADE